MNGHKLRILSSENDASVKVQQDQNTNITLKLEHTPSQAQTLPSLIMATFHRSRPETLISRLTLRTKTDRLRSLSLYSHVMRTIRSSSTNSLSASTKHS